MKNKRYNYKKKKSIIKRLQGILFVGTCLVILTVYFNIVAENYSVTGSTTDEYTTVKIHEGENLWSIASRIKKDDTDIREAIYEITKANNISANDIAAGMELKIPISIYK